MSDSGSDTSDSGFELRPQTVSRKRKQKKKKAKKELSFSSSSSMPCDGMFAVTATTFSRKNNHDLKATTKSWKLDTGGEEADGACFATQHKQCEEEVLEDTKLNSKWTAFWELSHLPDHSNRIWKDVRRSLWNALRFDNPRMLVTTLQKYARTFGVELPVLLRALEVAMWKWKGTFATTIRVVGEGASYGIIPIAAGNTEGVACDNSVKNKGQGAVKCLAALLELPISHSEEQLLLALQRAEKKGRVQAVHMLQRMIDHRPSQASLGADCR